MIFFSPKLGNSYTGGQYFYLTSLETNIDLEIDAFDITTTAFIDVGSVWGLENPAYGSIEDKHEARSSIGVNLNWDSAIGPINIIYANIIKSNKRLKNCSFSGHLFHHRPQESSTKFPIWGHHTQIHRFYGIKRWNTMRKKYLFLEPPIPP